MRVTLRVFGLAALSACCFAPVGASADEMLKYPMQGLTRTAILHSPISASGRAAPLVIVLHGLGGDGADFEKWSGFDSLSDREGFLVVYPDAVEGKWSYGRPIIAPMPEAQGKPVDDVGFVRALIDDLVARKAANPKRVYATGMSRGALMDFTLACSIPDQIAAIAPIASPMTEHQVEDCKANRPFPVMMMSGTNDYSQTYDGMLSPLGRLQSIPETLEYWRRLDGCTGEDSSRLKRADSDAPSRVVLVDWTGCKPGSGLRFYRIEGGGHDWPQFASADEGASSGSEKTRRRVHDVDAPTEIWNFVKQFQTP